MRKNTLLVGVLLAAGALTFGLSGCQTVTNGTATSQPAASVTAAAPATVKLNYGTAKEAGTFAVEAKDSMTAFDALTQAAAAHGFEIQSTDSQYGKYIQAINGVKEDGKNFWFFSVNGESAQQSADATLVKAGDSIEFNFQGM
jgi:hypothetical protein